MPEAVCTAYDVVEMNVCEPGNPTAFTMKRMPNLQVGQQFVTTGPSHAEESSECRIWVTFGKGRVGHWLLYAWQRASFPQPLPVIRVHLPNLDQTVFL